MLNLPMRWMRPLMLAAAIAMSSCGTNPEPMCPDVGFTVVEPNASPAIRPARDRADHTINIRRDWITTTSDIAEIRIAPPEYGDDGDVLILIKFTPEADQRLHDATTDRSGMRMAFMFNDEALLNFVWEGPYGMYTGGSQVSMQRGMKHAQRLMKEMRACKGVIVRDVENP